ncbi:MAG: hypothetical protein H6729_07865 [Deltaproteobacteria bacterium]|nr:hypothetical protein [Deltaproteobacteria bacterium]
MTDAGSCRRGQILPQTQRGGARAEGSEHEDFLAERAIQEPDGWVPADEDPTTRQLDIDEFRHDFFCDLRPVEQSRVLGALSRDGVRAFFGDQKATGTHGRPSTDYDMSELRNLSAKVLPEHPDFALSIRDRDIAGFCNVISPWLKGRLNKENMTDLKLAWGGDWTLSNSSAVTASYKEVHQYLRFGKDGTNILDPTIARFFRPSTIAIPHSLSAAKPS